jgi:hypothetical protein
MANGVHFEWLTCPNGRWLPQRMFTSAALPATFSEQAPRAARL